MLRGLATPAMAVISTALGFRACAIVLFIGTVAEAGVGIGLAPGGAGLWALVAVCSRPRPPR